MINYRRKSCISLIIGLLLTASVSIGSAEIRYQESHGPILIVLNNPYEGPVILKHLRIWPDGINTTAIVVQGPPDIASVVGLTVIIRDVTIESGFENGILLNNAWNARLDTVNIHGAYDGSMQNGIMLLGRSHDVHIDAVTIAHAETGILISGEPEGTIIEGSTLIGTTHGIFATSDFPDRAWLDISDSHIAASKAGIVVHNRSEVLIHDLLIYRHLRHWETQWGAFYGMSIQGKAQTLVSIRDVIVNCAPDAAQQYPGVGIALLSEHPLVVKPILHTKYCQ